jgi:hypothetical protein
MRAILSEASLFSTAMRAEFTSVLCVSTMSMRLCSTGSVKNSRHDMVASEFPLLATLMSCVVPKASAGASFFCVYLS